MADFKSHLPVQTHKDGATFTAASDYAVAIGGYESTGGTFEAAGINASRELFVVDATMRAATHLQDGAAAGGERGAYVLAVRQDVLATDTSADGDFAGFKVDALGRLYVAADVALDIQKAEDSAHVSGDFGIMSLGVRNDTNATLTDTDGDYSPFTVDKTGAMRVTVVDPTALSSEIRDVHASVATAVGATANHDYTVTALKLLKMKRIFASASGRIKVEVILDPVGTPESIVVGFNSTANPNVDIDLESLVEVAAGTVVRVAVSNLDEDPQDVYSTMFGNEV